MTDLVCLLLMLLWRREEHLDAVGGHDNAQPDNMIIAWHRRLPLVLLLFRWRQLLLLPKTSLGHHCTSNFFIGNRVLVNVISPRTVFPTITAISMEALKLPPQIVSMRDDGPPTPVCQFDQSLAVRVKSHVGSDLHPARRLKDLTPGQEAHPGRRMGCCQLLAPSRVRWGIFCRRHANHGIGPCEW